jgi:hypothetical protein
MRISQMVEVAFITAASGFVTSGAIAQWQGMCPNGHWVPSGYGYMCVKNVPSPRPYAPQGQASPSQTNPYENALIREAARLGDLLMSTAPLPGNGPLSSDLVNIPPPPGYNWPQPAAPDSSVGSEINTGYPMDIHDMNPDNAITSHTLPPNGGSLPSPSTNLSPGQRAPSSNNQMAPSSNNTYQNPTSPSIQSSAPSYTSPGTTLNPNTTNNQFQLGPNNCNNAGCPVLGK